MTPYGAYVQVSRSRARGRSGSLAGTQRCHVRTDRRDRLLAIVRLAAAGAAQAAPKAKATVSPEVHKKYGELMALGHKSQQKKDWKSAIGAFEKAVEAVPDDPAALTELGWTAYLAKDLDKAEAATKRAVASDGAPNIRGAALYNLGLIAEARHDTKGAIAAYIASIKARPHSVVRAALAKLDMAAAAAPRSLCGAAARRDRVARGVLQGAPSNGGRFQEHLHVHDQGAGEGGRPVPGDPVGDRGVPRRGQRARAKRTGSR